MGKKTDSFSGGKCFIVKVENVVMNVLGNRIESLIGTLDVNPMVDEYDGGGLIKRCGTKNTCENGW